MPRVAVLEDELRGAIMAYRADPSPAASDGLVAAFLRLIRCHRFDRSFTHRRLNQKNDFLSMVWFELVRRKDSICARYDPTKDAVPWVAGWAKMVAKTAYQKLLVAAPPPPFDYEQRAVSTFDPVLAAEQRENRLHHLQRCRTAHRVYRFPEYRAQFHAAARRLALKNEIVVDSIPKGVERDAALYLLRKLRWLKRQN